MVQVSICIFFNLGSLNCFANLPTTVKLVVKEQVSVGDAHQEAERTSFRKKYNWIAHSNISRKIYHQMMPNTSSNYTDQHPDFTFLNIL